MWKGYPNFWSDFEHKELVEIVWGNYEESINSTLNSLRETDDSKSILTVPGRLKQVWKAITFTPGKLEYEFTGDRVVEIPRLLDEEFEDAGLDYEIDTERNVIKLLSPNSQKAKALRVEQPDNHWTMRLWAPEVYTENPAVWKFFAPVLNIPEIEGVMEKHGIKNYSEEYYRTIRSLWYIFVNGPSLKNIEVGLLILFNIPHVIERSRVISKETLDGNLETIKTRVEATGRIETHTYDYTVFTAKHKVGDIVEAKAALVEGGAYVEDYITSPNWWEDLPLGPTRAKISLIEKYCTYLIRLNATLVTLTGSENLNLPPVLNSFLRKISPSFVKYLVVTFLLSNDELKLDDIGDDLEFNFRNGVSFCDAVFDDKLDNVLVLKGRELTHSFTANSSGVVANFPKGAYIIRLDNRAVNVVQYAKRDLILSQAGPIRITYQMVDFTGEIYVGYGRARRGGAVGIDHPFPSLKKHPSPINLFPSLTRNHRTSNKFEAIIDMRNAIELEWIEVFGERLTDYTVHYVRRNIGEGYALVVFNQEVDTFAYGLLVAPRICGVDEKIGHTHPFPSLEKHPSNEHLFPSEKRRPRRFEDRLTIKGKYDPSTYRHRWPSLVKYPSTQMKP